MNIMTIFFTSFFVALSGALSPGPLLAVTTIYSIKNGAKQGPLIVIGHSILELVLLILLLFGISNILKIKFLTKIISLVGSLVLMFMGLQFLINSKKFIIENSYLNFKMFNPILAGIIVSLSNPYWIIWWLTIGVLYITSAIKYGTYGIISFFLGHISADFIWYSLVSFIFSKSKKFINEKIYFALILICGIGLIFLGLYFIFNFYF